MKLYRRFGCVLVSQAHRISLGQFGVKEGAQFTVRRQSDGTLVLTPMSDDWGEGSYKDTPP